MKMHGIIGFPIGHSASPAMQMAAFRKAGFQTSIYMPFEVSPAQLKDTVQTFREFGVRGFNVTIPHKEKIIRYLDGISEEAKLIGAVNTVKNVKGRFLGYNTDAPGFIQSLKCDLKFEPRKKNCFIIGAGGAGRAIAFALAQAGAKEIYITDLAKNRAGSLVRNIKKHFPKTAIFLVTHMERSIVHGVDLVVNATPMGMKNKDPLPIDPRILHKGLSIYDLVYNPLPTRLVSAAKKKGVHAVNGLGMLLHQGALSFKIWTGRRADIVSMKKALLRHLR